MVRIGPLHVAIAGGIALLLVGVGGVVADAPAAEQPAVDEAVDTDTASIQDETNDSQESPGIVAPTEDDDPYVVGEPVPIELALNESEVATVTIGSVDAPQNARFTATVRENGSSGNVTLTFNTEAFDIVENDGFAVGDGADLVNTSSEYGDGVAESGLNPVTYNITLAEGEQPHYEEGVNVTDRSVLQLIDPQVTIDAPTSGDVYEGGDELAMDLSFQDADVGTVSVTFVGESATFTATVSDDDGDGTANLTFDPAAVPDDGDGFSAGDGTTLEDTSADTGDSVGAPSLYDVSVAPGTDAPGTGDVTATDSAELVVSGGEENGTENGQENGTENGQENGTENGQENGDENGQENGTENGQENGTENGDENGDENGTENGMENGEENGGASENGQENGDESGVQNDGNESSDDESSDGDGAGFGVLAVVGAVVAVALLARKRIDA